MVILTYDEVIYLKNFLLSILFFFIGLLIGGFLFFTFAAMT